MENGKCKCPQGKVLKGDKCETINVMGDTWKMENVNVHKEKY